MDAYLGTSLQFISSTYSEVRFVQVYTHIQCIIYYILFRYGHLIRNLLVQ